MTVQWFGKKVQKAIEKALEEESHNAAKKIESEAKTMLRQKAEHHSPGGLLTQFSVIKSKFKDGGWLVGCQLAGNWKKPYHASFVELGTYKDEAQPFLRPTMNKNKRPTQTAFKKAIDKL